MVNKELKNALTRKMKINIDTITRAGKELIGNIIRTPTIRSQHLSSEINGETFLKLENLQYTSSFKVRGAHTSIIRLKEEQKKMGVIAMSAGNHAQAVAWWAKKERVNATIVMPEHAPLFKVMKTKSLGADVILRGRTLNESQTYVSELVNDKKLTLIHPYDDPNVIIGQGTVGLEFMEDIKIKVVLKEPLIAPLAKGQKINGFLVIETFPLVETSKEKKQLLFPIEVGEDLRRGGLTNKIVTNLQSLKSNLLSLFGTN